MRCRCAGGMRHAASDAPGGWLSSHGCVCCRRAVQVQTRISYLKELDGERAELYERYK